MQPGQLRLERAIAAAHSAVYTAAVWADDLQFESIKLDLEQIHRELSRIGSDLITLNPRTLRKPVLDNVREAV